MKRTISSLILALALTASAATFDGTMLYGYCTNPQGALEFPEKATVGMAMQFTDSDIQYFTGGQITAICIANGRPANGATVTQLPVNLFTCSGFASNGTAEGMVSYPGTMDLTAPGEYKEYPLDEPIAITEGMESFWVGMTAESDPAVCQPLMFDSFRHTGTEGGMVGVVEGPGLPMQFADMSAMYGFGCIRVKVSRPGLPADQASYLQCHIPEFGISAGQTQVDMYVLNEAANDINTLTVEYTLGDEKGEKEFALATPLIYNNYTQLSLPFALPAGERNDLRLDVTVTKVNGQVNTIAETRANDLLIMERGNGFRRNMVAEIATGTWCGYCPMGIVGVEKMLEAHPDGSFIPIAVHTNDQMTTTSYDLFRTNFVGSNAPTLVVNRNTQEYGMENPTWEMMSGMYPFVTSTPAMAQLTIDNVTEEERQLNVEASVRFAFKGSGDYGLAYVLTEDGVGPYMQANYFNQSGAPEMGQWNELPDYVPDVYFGSVARQINLFNGVKNSVPADFDPGQDYGHQTALRTNTVQNLNNCHIVVMLINRLTGRIENAVTAPYSRFASLDRLPTLPVDAPAYDLQGRRTAAPRRGQLLIQNGKITKN